jgi:AcrR family transcriptional regulator
MKQGKRVQKKEKTKQAILKAALELFAAKGFYATTTKAISQKAQIAEGTLFNYFETKEGLSQKPSWRERRTFLSHYA